MSFTSHVGAGCSSHVLFGAELINLRISSAVTAVTAEESGLFQRRRGSVWNIVDGRRSSRCPKSVDFVHEKGRNVISRLTSSLVVGYLAQCVVECSPQAPCVAFTGCNFVPPEIAVLRLVQHAQPPPCRPRHACPPQHASLESAFLLLAHAGELHVSYINVKNLPV